MKADPRMHGPTHLTILPTYRCTAACAQCCFESNPHVQGRIPLPRIFGAYWVGAALERNRKAASTRDPIPREAAE